MVCPRPLRSPSLSGYPECDQEVKRLADELWADCDGKTVREHRLGKGRIVWGGGPEYVLANSGVKPDFSTGGVELNFIHRRVDDKDLYFVANRAPREVMAMAAFRVEGKTPEFWWPDSGRISPALAYQEKDGLTTVPMKLEPRGSVFVVFRKKAADREAAAIVSIVRDGRELLSKVPANAAPAAGGEGEGAIDIAKGEVWQSGRYSIQTADGKKRDLDVTLSAPSEIAGAWEVQFDPKWGGPAEAVKFEKLDDWSTRTEKGIKYFSGTAVYRKTFTVPTRESGQQRRFYLDLGSVQVIARVKLNGKDLGVLWKPPFRLDVTDMLAAGENQLGVQVTNLWPNRMIGDEQLPEDSPREPSGRYLEQGPWPKWLAEGKPSPTGRYTFTTCRMWKKGDALLESGLLGPVRVVPVEIIKLTE